MRVFLFHHGRRRFGGVFRRGAQPLKRVVSHDAQTPARFPAGVQLRAAGPPADQGRGTRQAVRRVLGREPQAEPDHRDLRGRSALQRRAAEFPVRGVRGAGPRLPPEVPRPRARNAGARRASPGRTGCRTRSSRSTASRRSRNSSFPTRLLPVDQFYNIANSLAQLGSGTSAQPFVTVKDYDDWLRRAARAPVIFEQAIVNMREGMQGRRRAAARAHGEGAAAARRQRRG